MDFSEICCKLGLESPKFELTVYSLSELALTSDQYVVPVFACFKHWALPIVSCWIDGNADPGVVLASLARLAPLIPVLEVLIEHFVAMHRTSLVNSNINMLQALAKLLLHDHARYSQYFRADQFREIANSSGDLKQRSWSLICLGLWMELGEKKIGEWLNEYSRTGLDEIEFRIVFKWAQVAQQDRQIFNQAKPHELSGGQQFKSPYVTEICGIFLPRIGGNDLNATSLVETPSFVANVQNSVKKLLLNRPLLLIGEPGCGKTSVVEYLHSRLRSNELVRIHLGDQTDAKALIGNYTSGSQVGTFEWTPGALTVAVQQGSWILIEDIDRAPTELVAVLLSLLTRQELVIPSRNQVIRAAPGFQLIATTSQYSPELIGERSFSKVELQSLSNDDLVMIIMKLKPHLSELAAQMFVTVFHRVEEWQYQRNLVRKANTRDLFKFVNRLNPKYSNDDMFREAVTCFTSFLSKPEPLCRVIGEAMNIPDSQVGPLVERNRPQLDISEELLHVGRASVARRKVTISAARNLDVELNSTSFALTQPTLKLMEEITLGVQHVEPVLLVGETGTGKTTVVQHLAKACRRKLVVINVSQQVETGDLVGGFKPVDARQLAGALLEEFNELFDSTFNRAKNHQFIGVLDKIVAKQQWNNLVKLLREAVKMASSSREGNEIQPKRARKDNDWPQFSKQIDAFESRLETVQKAAQFQFIEGLLVRALRQGHWVLLDELNLAPADTIEGISEILSSRRITLLENGGQVVYAHRDFRLFANMNPATDVGKRDIPLSVRQHFTEVWSPSPDSDPEALRAIVARYLPTGIDKTVVNDVSILYTTARELVAAHQLSDGAGQAPHFSIRTLSRALTSAAKISPIYGLRRALFESFSMCFLTLLDESSANLLCEHAVDTLLSKLPNQKSVMSQIPPAPSPNQVQFQHWWIPCSSDGVPENEKDYILTPSVERNLLNLVRATALKSYPVLIQGPTSSGKTSMISYLAKRTGHKVIRINNHEHTDLAEYMGGYESDSNGILVFKEGALVTALKQGHWLILDELNLAPTDVLEALNRLLDDNRELLVPETQEIVKPHPDFVLFATQNPPGIYAGRKVLSRAFRNRFLELHFGDLPENELEQIVRDRTGIAPSYAGKIVEVYKELGLQRIQRVFEQSATLRDLFRWAKRPAIGYEQLAFNGYALLAERCRTKQDKEAVKKVIEKVMRVPINTDIASFANPQVMEAAPSSIVWTGAMRRVLALVEMALQQNEPVLLVGETGCGKTTIVQTLASAQNRDLLILNAHQNTETGDLVGGQRPVRSRNTTRLFEWVDGPLVTALKSDKFFLLDEISLADDSVLERLNSVLEPERTLFVPEIGSIGASPGFQFFSTMNPGGDYGKKELSPALRNRFTEIWVPTVDSDDDLRMIVEQRLSKHCIASSPEIIVNFSQWFNEKFHLVSLRDILSWVEFLNASDGSLKSVIDGASMVFIDGLAIHSTLYSVTRMRQDCLNKLIKLTGINHSYDFENCDTIYGEKFSIGGFELPYTGQSPIDSKNAIFNLSAPTSALNAMRVVRAMQVQKPVLLEGSPGAGKTSLIAGLAQLCGAKLTRINLSDQTDLADLFGQDVPLEEPGKFGWRTAPFLRAMQLGEWVLLDEMNLAPQPVLEGLNACLDHRGEAYIPELDRSFTKHPSFTVFAAQNPHSQGGGRKGLPKSFMNRFSIVYVEPLGLKDLHAISASTHPSVSSEIREKLSEYVQELSNWSTSANIVGGPFEFNLRDTLRWLDLVSITRLPAQKFLPMLVIQRFRSTEHREMAQTIFDKYFDRIETNYINPVNIVTSDITIGDVVVQRTDQWRVHEKLFVLPTQIPVLETALQCVAQSWPLIITGPSGTGKSSIIKLLAQLCGRTLYEFAVTADIDSTDLLGEFDQLELESERQQMWSIISEEIGLLSNMQDAELYDAMKNQELESLKTLLDPSLHPKSCEAVKNFESIDFSKPIFKWVDGMLVKALEQGGWLVLDNANLCSAAVLDRLNSLLERGGSLLINECSQADGSPREIIPHPNFRLFLTVNPKYGELSRAMRNRGVEVWLEEQPTCVAGVASELSLRFSKPLVLSRVADLKSSSWLRALLINDQCPVDSIESVDSQLGLFIKSGSIWSTFDELWSAWNRFQLQCIITDGMEKARTGFSDQSLFNKSLQRHLKDSVDCDFDIYGLLVYAQGLTVVNTEFWSMLIDLSHVEDPSRVPTYRDWFLNFCEEFDQSNGVNDLKSYVISTLGRQYDFKDGGDGMELLWQKFGRIHGFSSIEDHENDTKVKNLATSFDLVAKKFGSIHTSSISTIRHLLCQTQSVDDEIQLAVETFHNSVKDAAGKPQILSDQFRELFNIVALSYVTKPTSHLFAGLVELSVKAQISTEELKALAISSLSAPRLVHPLALESIASDIFRLTQQGIAADEVGQFTKFLIDFGTEISQMMSNFDATQALSYKLSVMIRTELPDLQFCKANTTVGALDFATELLHRYVCPLPLDPAIGQHIWYERFINAQNQLSNDRNCWQLMQSQIGSNSTVLSNWLSDRQIKEQPVPSIWRPKSSSIGIVHRDMIAALHLVNQAGSSTKSADELQLMLQNSSHLSNRLARKTEYADLTAPVRAALAIFQLHLSELQRHAGVSASPCLHLLNPFALLNGLKSIEDTGHTLLEMESLLSCSTKDWHGKLHRIVNSVYQTWSMDRLVLEEKQREQLSGVRYIDESDTDAVEREFKMMFPDYDEATELPKQQDGFVPNFVQLFCKLMLSEPEKALLVELLVKNACEIGISGDLLNLGSRNASLYSLPTILIALDRRAKANSATLPSGALNFYLDSNTNEATLSAQYAERLTQRIDHLLEKWPEHETLKTLSHCAKDIIELPPAAPTALHLSKVEQIHHNLYEWDRFASKEYKVGDMMAAATSLIVKWRQLELATWPALFAVEKDKAAELAAPFWFHLYGTLIFAPSEDSGTTAKVLVLFMSESSIGQYAQRLRLLEAFENFAKDENIRSCIRNIRQYFSQFSEGIELKLQSVEKQLRKQVDEVVKLASWRDVNIHALKQSAQRSHRQLFKHVRKFRQLLNTNAVTDDSTVITRDFEANHGILNKTYQSNERQVMFQGNWAEFASNLISHTNEQETKPNHLRNLGNITSSVTSYISSLNLENTQPLLELANDIENRATKLRVETPKTWNKENKKEISALKVEKQQLLTSALKELRNAGLKTGMSRATVAEQSELTRVLATAPNLNLTSFGGSDSYWFALIELLPRLRSAVSDAAISGTVDVPQNDLHRGMALSEDAFNHILKLRQAAFGFSIDIPKSLEDLSDLVRNPIDCSLPSALDNLEGLAKQLNGFADLFEEVFEITQTAHQAPTLLRNLAESSRLTGLAARSPLVSEWSNSAKESLCLIGEELTPTKSAAFLQSIIEELVQNVELATSTTSTTTSQATVSLNQMKEKVTSASNSVLVIVQQVVTFVKSTEESKPEVKGELKIDPEEDYPEQSDANWFVKQVKLYTKLLAILRPHEMIGRLDSAALSVFDFSREDSKKAAGYAASLLVFIQGYMRLSTKVERAFSTLLCSSTQATYKFSTLLYSLATVGFCSPQPLEGDEDEEDAKGDGVGLGDGTGANSSSKDVDEDDDDVAEAMQTKNPDQQEHEDDGEKDNAKEMEGDMAGDVEDAPPKNEDDSEDEDVENDDEIEEEIGELEDLDPNAVDEKMWDDQSKESNEKQTDEQVDGAKDDEAQAGAEQDPKEQQNQDQEEGNDAGNDDDNQENEDAEEDRIGGDQEELDDGTEQKDALDLPDDLQLDGDSKDADENNDLDDDMNDDVDDSMDDAMDDAMDEEETTKVDQADSNAEADLQSENEEDEDAMGEPDTEDKAEDDELSEYNEMQDDDFNDPSEQSELPTESITGPQEEATDGDAQGADIEGLHGPNDNQSAPDQEQATTTEQYSENAGQGNAQDASTEESHIGEGGTSGANQQPLDQDQETSLSSEQVKESLKQLGDAMQQFHRRQQAIREREEREEPTSDIKEPSTDDKPLSGNEEFEHVGADDAFDTQALGKASENAEQEIDQSMAIDDTVKDEDEPPSKEVAGDEQSDAEHGAGGADTIPGADAEDEESDTKEQSLPFSNTNRDSDFDDEDDEELPEVPVPDEPEVVNQVDESDFIWQRYEAKTHNLALLLGEQLRLILEPTVASKLRGDYRTGKRLNMKRIIPYIASEFRKDKIWLRRTKPAKREYQVLLSLDDSKSMADPAVIDLAFQAIALVGKALSTIEAGQVGIAKFGSSAEIVHPLNLPLTTTTGNEILQKFRFDQQRTNVNELLVKSLQMFSEVSSGNDQWKLHIIVSDGIADDHPKIKRLVRQAYDERVMVVFVVLDALNKGTSVLDMNEVRYTTGDNGAPKLEVVKYFENFPFDYYVIVRDINDLPMVLANVLRQYFQAQQ